LRMTACGECTSSKPKAKSQKLRVKSLVTRSQQRIFHVQYAVAKGDASSRDRGNALARNDDSNQVQRICCRDDDALALRILWQLAVGAQGFDCHRKGELLSRNPSTNRPPRTSL